MGATRSMRGRYKKCLNLKTIISQSLGKRREEKRREEKRREEKRKEEKRREEKEMILKRILLLRSWEMSMCI